MEMTLMFICIVVVLVFMEVPIAVSLGFATTLTLIIFRPIPSLFIIPQLFSQQAASFTMLAVPLFILTGSLMEKGSVGRNLIDFTTSIVGWMTGGLGQVNIFGSMIFGGISGSSLADTATFGSILVPKMVEDGYDRDYSGAVTLTSSCLSVVIPPSILLVLAASATQQSVARALAGGLVPGMLITVLLMIVNYVICKKNKYGVKIKFSIKNVLKTFTHTWTAMIAPLIILGSIFSGIVTPTEGAALAVFYVLLIDFVIFKKLKVRDIYNALVSTAKLTSAILFIVTSSALANFIISFEGVPFRMAEFLSNLPGGIIGFLIFIDVLLVIIGMTLDASPATIIFLPLFLPVATQLGVDPTHFIIMSVTGFAIGLTTPPYGVCLYSLSSVCNIPMQNLVKKAVPFYVMLFASLILVTFIPQITLALPKLLGL